MTALEAELIAEVERLQKELDNMQNTEIGLILSNESLLRELESEREKFQNSLKKLKESFKESLQSLESDYQKQLQTLQTELENLSQ